MRYLSAELARRLQDNSTLTAKATIKFADGTERQLGGGDFYTLSIEQASSSSGSFDIGAAVVGQLSCTLNNTDDRFSEYDFEGASLTVWVGTSLPSGNEEWVKLGVYYVDRPDSYSGQIFLTALDSLSLLEKDFSVGALTWPRTLQQIVEAGCTACGLINDTSSIPNGSYLVSSEPDLDNATWLDVMGYVAQATGTFVRATADGHIEFAWYDTVAFEREDWLDGKSFDAESPYASGDSADGGSLSDYSSGGAADGGSFANAGRMGQVNRFSSLTVFTDDVVITGVSVTAQNEISVDASGNETNGKDGETALYGSEGYVLSVPDNPLVLYGHAATVASQVGKRVVGMRFRPFSCDAIVDPSIEPGDAIIVTDRKNNQYRSYVTSVSLSVNGSESIACSAQSTSRHLADKASAATKAIVKARNDLNRERNARELAQADMERRLEEASGLFTTSVKQADGSSVIYMHDKSDLASSKIVWKFTSAAVAVSTTGPDGPYLASLAADGNAILNRIYAAGIDASYITAGTLDASRVKIENLTTIGDRGSNVAISADSITFQQGGSVSLVISPSGIAVETRELVNNVSGKPYASVTGPNNTETVTTDFYPGNPHHPCYYKTNGDGTFTVWYSLTIRLYSGGSGNETTSTWSEEVTLPWSVFGGASASYTSIEIYNSDELHVSLLLSNPAIGSANGYMDCALSIVMAPTGSYLMQLWSASLSVWKATYASAITDARTGAVFLTSENYKAFLNQGRTLSGSITIPYVYNNYNKKCTISVENGLITGYDFS